MAPIKPKKSTETTEITVPAAKPVPGPVKRPVKIGWEPKGNKSNQ